MDVMSAEGLRSALRELAGIAPEGAPFVSLYLDTTVGADGQRPGLTFLRAALERQARRLGVRGPARASYDADRARIEAWVADELDPAAQGVAIFACNARGIFHSAPLAVAPENRLTVAQAPRLYQLARVLDDYETWCVVVLNRIRARIFTVALGGISKAAELKQSPYQVSKTLAGGMAQGRYQRHVEQNIRGFVEEVATEAASVCRQTAPSRLVLAGEPVALAELERLLPERLAGSVVEVQRFDADIPEHELLAALTPIVAAEERSSEAEAVAALEEETAKSDLAVVGVEPSLLALEQGQVDRLVISNGFAEKGWRCGQCLSYGVGGLPQRCPYCGGGLVEADLRESLVGAAQRTGASIEFVQDVPRLDELGGVGAFLRYPLT